MIINIIISIILFEFQAYHSIHTNSNIHQQQQSLKHGFHYRNKHKYGYNFNYLIKYHDSLLSYLYINKYGNQSIDFSNDSAVKALNSALLKAHYNLQSWDIPNNYLCPPIPSRVDYIHHLADLIADMDSLSSSSSISSSGGYKYDNDITKDHNDHDSRIIPTGKTIKGLDIGMGANCIYPILGVSEYNWSFVGTEIDKIAIDSVKKIIESNPILIDNIEIRHQSNNQNIFIDIIKENDKFDFCCCNPPFHSSMTSAIKGTQQKWRRLGYKTNSSSGRSSGSIGSSSSSSNGGRGSKSALNPTIDRLSSGVKSANTLNTNDNNIHHVRIKEDTEKIISSSSSLNFGGMKHELCYEYGGEIGFISKMIIESSNPYIHKKIRLFTTLVSSSDSLSTLLKLLSKQLLIKEYFTIDMNHGNKKSRILVWRY